MPYVSQPQIPPQQPPPGYPTDVPYGYPADAYGYPADPSYAYPPPGPGYPGPAGHPGFPPGQVPPGFGYGMRPPKPGPPPHLLANQGVRLGSRMIDFVILILAMVVVVVLFAAIGEIVGDARGDVIGFGVLGALVLGVLVYEPLMHARFGGTLGKMMCGLRVVRVADGQHLSFGAALGRAAVVFPFALVPFGSILNALWCLWDEPNRQCLHDKVAGSVVIRRNPPEAPPPFFPGYPGTGCPGHPGAC